MAATLTAQTTFYEGSSPTVTVASGERIIVVLRERDGSAMSVSSSLDGALTQVVTRSAVIGRASIFYLQNPTVGSHTLTISGGTVRDGNAMVWAGLQNAAADTSNSASNSSTTSHAHGAITPSATALIITAFASGDHGGVTPNTGFSALSIDVNGVNSRQYYAYKTSHTGSITPTHTSTNSTFTDACCAAFLETAASTPVVLEPLPEVPRRLPVARGPAVVGVTYLADVTAPVTPLSWTAVVPVLAGGPLAAASFSYQMLVETPSDGVVPSVGPVSAPNWIARRVALRPSGGRVDPAYLPDVTALTPALSWQGEGVDRIPLRVGRPAPSVVLVLGAADGRDGAAQAYSLPVLPSLRRLVGRDLLAWGVTTPAAAVAATPLLPPGVDLPAPRKTILPLLKAAIGAAGFDVAATTKPGAGGGVLPGWRVVQYPGLVGGWLVPGAASVPDLPVTSVGVPEWGLDRFPYQISAVPLAPTVTVAYDSRLFPRGSAPDVPPIAETVFGYQALATPVKPTADVLDQGLRFSLFPIAAWPGRRASIVRQLGGAWVPPRVPDVTATAPPLSWQGRAPEWIARRRGAALGWVAQSWSATIPFLDPTRLQWRGVAPDWLRRASLPVAARPSLVGISPTPWPIPDTSWQGRWPDWLRGAPRPVANGGWGWEPFARPNPASPDSAWQGWYPERVLAPARLRVNGLTVGSVRLLPTLPPNVDSLAQMPGWVARAVVPAARQPRGADRIDVVIPDLRRDWAGSYPDRLARPTRPLTPASTVPAEYNRAIAPLDWYGEDQDPPTVFSRLYQRPEAVAPNPELLEGPAAALAWDPAPTWPVVRVWGRAGLVTSAAGVLTPAISAGPAICVHLAPVATTAPRLVAARVTSPGLQFCRLSSPTARGEVC